MQLNSRQCGVEKKDYPEKVIQFGEGNFLRAFVDWMFNELNKQGLFNGSVVVVQPIPVGRVEEVNRQDGLYNVVLRGYQGGQLVEKRETISCISRGINPYEDWNEYIKCAENPELRFVVSNTTEAGIAYDGSDTLEDVPQKSFPGKLTAFLYHRFKHFNGDGAKGMVIIPCELIDRNGDKLKEIVLRLADDWKLPDGFKEWIKNSNYFLNTLVDRIVTGYSEEEAQRIQKEKGYMDKLVVTGEIFHLWVIEGDACLKEELPFDKAGLNVVWTDDVTPYRARKVRILNGAHTMTVPVAYLHGLNTVRESIEDELIGKFMRKGIYGEIIPTLDLEESQLVEFADSVIERFRNPYIKHRLLDISLNSISKFKTRVLPSLLKYHQKFGQLPGCITFSLAALIAFYKGERIEEGRLVADRSGEEYLIRDDMANLEFFLKLWSGWDGSDRGLFSLVEAVLKNEQMWGEDLSRVEGLGHIVTEHLRIIANNGTTKGLELLL